MFRPSEYACYPMILFVPRMTCEVQMFHISINKIFALAHGSIVQKQEKNVSNYVKYTVLPREDFKPKIGASKADADVARIRRLSSI